MSNTTENSPRIYVASLADYNAGRLHGRWIDAAQTADEIHAEIASMLEESRELVAEDWAIHDYENFAGLRLEEFTDIEYVAQVASLIDEHGPVFAHLLNRVCDLSEAIRYMRDGYRGAYERLEHHLQELVEDFYADELAKLPDFVRYHIDYEAIAHDLECSGDIFTVECDGRVHVFDTQF